MLESRPPLEARCRRPRPLGDRWTISSRCGATTSWYDQPGAGSGSGGSGPWSSSSSCCWSVWLSLEPILRAEGHAFLRGCGAGPRLDIVWPDQPGEVEQGLRMYMHARQGAEPQGHGSRRGHGRSRAAGQHGFQAVRRTALRCTALLVRRQTGRQTVSLPCFYPNFKSMPKSLSGRRALHMRAEPVKRG